MLTRCVCPHLGSNQLSILTEKVDTSMLRRSATTHAEFISNCHQSSLKVARLNAMQATRQHTPLLLYRFLDIGRRSIMNVSTGIEIST